MSQPTIQRLDHLGLISGFCSEIKLAKMVDAILPKTADCNVTHGDALVAMILNGLGFHSRTLHMFPDFFKHKPLELLLGKEGILPEHLNDDVLGRTLDALYEVGCSDLYLVMAERVLDTLGIKPDSVHLDITSFHVDGEYKTEPSEDIHRIELVQGYSRDHRPDLNQVVLELICENQAGIPVYMQAMSGNTNDNKAFAQVTKEYVHCLKAAQESQYFVGDAALHSFDAIQNLSRLDKKFITRVPLTLKTAKQALLTLDANELIPFANGYAGKWVTSDYAGVKQRWLLIKSEQATKKEEHTFEKNLVKTVAKEEKAFKKLCKKQFACETDALGALSDFIQSCQFIGIDEESAIEVPLYKGKGRPAKGEEPEGYYYQLQGQVYTDAEKVTYAQLKIGMFILTTNELDDEKLPMAELLTNYKAQQSVERGFRFLKSPEFLTSAVYLKKPERIEALLMVMTCSLMVYAGIEHKIRTQLQATEPFYPDMKKKTTQKPTARWVFLTFEGIHHLKMGDNNMIVGLEPHHQRLIEILGPNYASFYS